MSTCKAFAAWEQNQQEGPPEDPCHACGRQDTGSILCASCSKRYRVHKLDKHFGRTSTETDDYEWDLSKCGRDSGFMTKDSTQVTCKHCIRVCEWYGGKDDA